MINGPVNSYAGIYYRHILSYMKKAFKLINLTFEEGVILQNIIYNPNTSQDRIANNLAFDAAAVARALKELEEKKYVVREIDRTNQRKKIVNITEKGKEVAEKVDMFMARWDSCIYSGMSEDEINANIEGMKKIKEKADLIDINALLSPFESD